MTTSQHQSQQDSSAFRVLFIDYGIGFGGAVVSMSNLVNNLASSPQLDVTVLSAQAEEIILPLLHGPKHLFFPMPMNYIVRERVNRKMTEMGVPKIIEAVVQKAYALVDQLARFYYRFFIFRTIKNNQIDLVHMNNAPELDAIVAANWAGVPCISHCRGLAGVDKQTLRYAPFNSTVKKFIAISQAVATTLRDDGVASEKIHVIHNPIDWQKYDAKKSQRTVVREQWGIAPTEIVVAIFGRITEWKGQLEFMQAVELIIARCPNLRVMVVGDSSDDVQGYWKKVEGFSQRDELRGRVVFTGYQQQVSDYYWAADIVIHNSILPEPFGRVIIEAMACARPVVAIAEGGPIDIIEQDVDGILVPPRDTPALAQAIEKLYNSAADRERLGCNAGKSAQERFGGHGIATQVLSVYKEVTGIEFSLQN